METRCTTSPPQSRPCIAVFKIPLRLRKVVSKGPFHGADDPCMPLRGPCLRSWTRRRWAGMPKPLNGGPPKGLRHSRQRQRQPQSPDENTRHGNTMHDVIPANAGTQKVSAACMIALLDPRVREDDGAPISPGRLFDGRACLAVGPVSGLGRAGGGQVMTRRGGNAQAPGGCQPIVLKIARDE